MRRGWRLGAAITLIVAGFAVAVLTGWGALVLFYLTPGPGWVRSALAWSFVALGLVTLGAVIVRQARRPALLAFALALTLVLVVWSSATPSNDRDWHPEVAVLPYATIDGDRVTVHNIRSFDYRTETDFTPAYYTRTFDLRRLDRVDLIAVYWMGPAIAHLFVSFGFGDDHLAISVEARKDRTKPYATIPGFFRQYELVYIVADERDVIRVRTNYRKSPPEEVYLFRAVGPIANGRRIFLDYMRDINELREHPRFYNTLTTNCTTMILAHEAVNPGHIPYSWKVLFSGYAPEYVYEQGRLDRSFPFEELKRRAHINAAAQAADQAPDFSRRIRVGVP
jgi:hypothetical protein